MINANEILQQIIQGNYKTLARTISEIENNECKDLLKLLPSSTKKIIGVTGPPGAGKSTLVDCLIAEFINQQKKVGILCIDPSSAFHKGALLGDRIRMNRWYNNNNVFIRSLASRGNAGGLHPAIIEITDVMKAAPFDIIIIETVGAGQTETEIASLADTTVVVLVPEAGDEIQMMKAGLIEIADVFVVNKSDRDGGENLVKALHAMLSNLSQQQKEIPVIKTIASENKGVEELVEKIRQHESQAETSNKKIKLLVEKAYTLIQQKRMRDVSKARLEEAINEVYKKDDFNVHRFVEAF